MEPSVKKFKKEVYGFYSENKRDLPWRNTRDPYKILLSETMLQQTQVPRVIPKYLSWITRFPDFTSVADAPVVDILEEWKGLGYNRRALAFKRACEIVVTNYKSSLPKEYKDLLSLPGVGAYTGRAVQTFAWNEPQIFIETNIRSVFIHYFFKDQETVHDHEILPLIEKTLDKDNPREWYWALMDYGSYLKKSGNPSRKSAHHVKQSPFKGSNREQRSHILKYVMSNGRVNREEIRTHLTLPLSEHDMDKNLEALVKEGFLKKDNDFYRIEG